MAFSLRSFWDAGIITAEHSTRGRNIKTKHGLEEEKQFSFPRDFGVKKIQSVSQKKKKQSEMQGFRERENIPLGLRGDCALFVLVNGKSRSGFKVL